MKNTQRTRLVAISLSFIIGAALMGIKFYAYRLTHSSAILSDALESIINVVASAFALVSILMAAMPPDDSHPYGHGKIEFFSAGFEGALIVLAAIGIFATVVTFHEANECCKSRTVCKFNQSPVGSCSRREGEGVCIA